MPKEGARTRLGSRVSIAANSGKQDNCRGGRQPVGGQRSCQSNPSPIAALYLPRPWVDDLAHAVPLPVCQRTSSFRPKPQIALDQLRAALAAGIAQAVVLADARIRHRHRLP